MLTVCGSQTTHLASGIFDYNAAAKFAVRAQQSATLQRKTGMCGIAGFIGADDRQHATRCVKAMVSALARRGPDGEGIEAWPEAVLGHRRLSIFDLSDAGRQPM